MSLFSSLFKTSKTPTYSGPTPYKSLLDSAGGQDYFKKITDRSNGVGVGYSPEYVDKVTNPVIARMRNQFNSYDLPELKSELTATGRRAGSPGFQQIAKAYENQGLNEEAAYAPIYQSAEQAKREDKNAGVQELGAFNTGDYNAQNTYANFDRDTFNTSMKNRQYDNEQNQSTAGRIVGAGAQLLFGGGGGYSPYGGGIPTGQSIMSGGVNYPVTAPPYGYNYNYQKPNQNLMQRLLLGRV